MILEITNRDELSLFFRKSWLDGNSVRAIVGPPPEGATYEDGTPITSHINHAWMDIVTGEIVEVKYRS